jgi:Protein of unknown function (DUF1592)/Protein of unknown function (DUF1588)/Protein of unknown function (DUF1595)/Protein of unknown function (DUF1585)/Protein of unknown function (DUF1587)
MSTGYRKLSLKRAGLFLPLAGAAALVAGTVGGGAIKAADTPADDDVQVSYRRLSQDQYRQSIADIFGADIKISGRLEPDPRREGLIAVGVANASISSAGFEQYDAAARAIAAQVTDKAHRDSLIGCEPANPVERDEACARAFIERTGRLLFRRPLQPGEASRYVALAAKAAQARGGLHAGLATALATMLESPAFLFRTERAVRQGGSYKLDDYSMASRLSFLAWNAPPDNELLAAAERGELSDPQGLARQLDRLLASPRFEHGVRAFFSDMLALDDLDGLQKDSAIYPRFSNRLAADAREQTLLVIVDALVRQDEDYRSLFTTRRTFLSRSLGLLYSMPVTTPTGWEPHEFAADDPRAGLVAQPAFLMGHSHPGRSSPTLRGKAIRELLLCQPVPAPPPNVNFAVVQNTKDPRFATARQRLQAHNDDAMCAGCHKIMDPLGLALENFDGAGGMRSEENGSPLDLGGNLGPVSFTGAAGLGEALSRDPALSECLVSRLYAYSAGRSPDSEAQWLDGLRAQQEAQGLRLRSLIRTLVLSEQFRSIPTGVTAHGT